MAETVTIPPERFGRIRFLDILTQAAAGNRYETLYQNALGDLKAKEQLEGMGKEVLCLAGDEKSAEVLSRLLILVVMMLPDPNQRAQWLFQVYTHFRAAGLIEAVKPQIGALVDLQGHRISTKKDQ